MLEDENSQLCRLCLKSGDCPIDIFQPKGTNGLLVWEIIKELIGIETSHSDGSPPTICEDCMRKLMEFKYFKKMCINSRIEFLMRQINNGLVVPVRVDESGPLREDLHCQGYLHARGSWSNVGAEGIKSEERDVFEGPPAEEDDSSSSDGNCLDDEVHCSDVDSGESVVTSLNCTDGVSVPVEGGGGMEGNSEETLTRKRGSNRLKGTGHQRSARKQYHAVVPVATHSYLKQRNLRSHSKNKNYAPCERIESTPSSTSGKQFGEKNGKCRQRKEGTRRGSKHGNGALAGNISIGSSVGDEKSEGQDFMCDGCGKVFRSKDLIERHVKVPCGSKLINCGNCNKKFWARNQYKRHKSLHCGSNVSRGRAQKGVSVGVSGESEDRRQINKGIPPICYICNKTFSFKNSLKVHIKSVHLKERNFSCEICGKAFAQKGTLHTHVRSHSGLKPYTCSHCQKRFTQSWTLRQHILAVHKVKKPYSCSECGKAFSQKRNRNTHMLIHTGERPHTCGICSKTFSQIANLSKHKLIHTGERSHACTICSKTFSQMANLSKHKLIHTGERSHACTICSKTFSQMANLSKHKLIHTGEKSHACTICSKTFSQMANLSKHKLIHTGEKSHACTICSKTFSQMANLKRHMATHARKVPHQ